MNYWESCFYSLPILLSQYNNILGEHEPFLYLRGDEVKYWGILIIIGQRGCIGELLKHILFPIVEDYWGMGNR